MRIGIIGATGFLGSALCELAIEKGYSVVGFSRRKKQDADGIKWRVFNDTTDLSGLDAVVNYAGESIAQRWSEEKKKSFYDSRVGVTNIIKRRIDALPEGQRPKVLVNASAVGYYGDCGDVKLDEESPLGDGYLAELCKQWEDSAFEVESLGVRVVIGRIGLIIGKGGEAWKKMTTAFKLGLGGPIGNGKHWMPWMHVKDVAGGTLHAIEVESIRGPLNLVSPDPRKNKDFSEILGSAMNRPTLVPAPVFALKIVFGEFGKHLVDSYRVYPKVLEGNGYTFYYPELNQCLKVIV